MPGGERVSAVLFNNRAGISKFNRMGVLASFGSQRVKMIREGFAIDPSPNAAAPRAFRRIVNEKDYDESWIQGMDVYHTPSAKQPPDPYALPGATHHRLLKDG